VTELSEVAIQPMSDSDVHAAAAAIHAGGWGERRASLEFFAGHSASEPIVAESHGRIVGTSVGTYSGSVGWLGLVFVAPAWRGRGLGGALARASLATLERHGCETVLLAATELGKLVYDRLGFVADALGGYSVWRGPRRQAARIDSRLRFLAPHDLPQIYALDRAATDEDRAHAIRALADGWVLDQGERLHGYALRTPWGSGPAIAQDASDGVLLLDQLISQNHDAEIRIIQPTANAPGAEALLGRGFSVERQIPRMHSGNPVDWYPDHIWAIFNFALG
jgi:GNAT superfamily N-acetyltransferase